MCVRMCVLVEMYGTCVCQTSIIRMVCVFVLVEMYGISECPNGNTYGIVFVLVEMYGISEC